MFRFALVCLALVSTASAAEPVRVGGEGARQPRLAIAPDGAIHLAFGAGDDLYCARSEDGGKNFSEPAKVATLPGLMLGMRRGPRVAVAGEAVVVTAIGRADGDLVSWRSTDRGRKWDGPTRVNDVEKACREGLHDTAAVPDGDVAALWLDLRTDKTELWMSVSRDGGGSWGESRRVYRSPSGSICECCHPTLTADGDGWRFLWRNSLGGNRDIYVSGSSDERASSDEAVMLGKVNWPLAACPMDGGDLAPGKKEGEAWAVWRREWTCYAASANDPEGERVLGPGEQPVAAVTPAGPVFAWLARRPGDLLVLTPGEKEPRVVAKNASDPDLIVGPAGELVLAWERVEEKKTSVFVTRLTVDRPQGER